MAAKDVTEKALSWLKNLPRVSLSNLRCEPGFLRRRKRETSKFQHGGGKKCRQNFVRVGFEGGNTPFYLKFSREPYYEGHHLKRQYPPITLLELQKLIDTDRLDTSSLIDVTSICNTGLYTLNPNEREFGFQITDEGLNKFEAKIDIEVQWASETVIAAIEKLGGSITLAYYDLMSLRALTNPEKFFHSGTPIPRRLLPPEDIIADYINPKNRGYLANPQEVENERGILAQKYGYEFVRRDPPQRKDPRQVFLGLEPGWVVNLNDKVILKPKDPDLIRYYTGPTEKRPLEEAEQNQSS